MYSCAVGTAPMAGRRGGVLLIISSLFLLQQLWLYCVWAEDDFPCLSGFKKSVRDPRNSLASWKTTSSTDDSMRGWWGVQLWNDAENRVLSLNLTGAGLSGSLSAATVHLSQCVSLTRLSLASNRFTGAIPSNLYHEVPFLSALDLSHNLLDGSIPSNLASCLYLNLLFLQDNNLSGEIPSQLGDMTRLTNLNLSSNAFSGRIPISFTNRSIPFDKTAFANNPHLCGSPLVSQCPGPPFHRKGKVRQLQISIGAALLLIVIGLACWWTGRCKLQSALLKQLYLVFTRCRSGRSKYSNWPETHLNLTWEELKHATSFFSPANIIGHGGSSTVYKGRLCNGWEIAVKVLKCEEQQHGTAQLHPKQLFLTELNLLGKLRHRNLVKVHGFYCDSEHMAIILDYMPAGSLEALLRHESATSNLAFGWKVRLNMLLGIAKGLAYLHNEYDGKQSVVHADLKPGNVLLNEYMEAHIADFGIATVVNSINTQSNVNVLAMPCWSLGYAAPELVQEGLVSQKGDVFSFGVIVLEMMTGEPPSSNKLKEGESLVNWVSEALAEEDVDHVLAPNLFSVEDITMWRKDLSAVLSMGCSCASIAQNIRPKMSQVVEFLRRFCEKLDGCIPYQTLDVYDYDKSIYVP